jgi:hypothetical protein
MEENVILALLGSNVIQLYYYDEDLLYEYDYSNEDKSIHLTLSMECNIFSYSNGTLLHEKKFLYLHEIVDCLNYILENEFDKIVKRNAEECLDQIKYEITSIEKRLIVANINDDLGDDNIISIIEGLNEYMQDFFDTILRDTVTYDNISIITKIN